MKKLLTLILPALVLTAGPKPATGDAASYYYRGEAKSLLDDREGAKADWKRAAESKADDAASYYQRGEAKRRLGDEEGAKADYQRAAESKADDAASYYYRGRAKNLLDDQSKKADYQRAAESKAGDAASYYQRGVAKYWQRPETDYRADYQRAAESKADDAASYYYRGRAKSLLKDREGAKADYQRAAESMIDEGVPQVADAASPAPVEATADAPAQDPAGTAGTADGASGERYGAFAIDEGAWAYGFSLLAPSRDRADRAALARCVQEGGSECEIKYVFNGSRCGAAAVAEEQGLRAWGYGHAESRGEAVATAMGFCERDNTSGGECRLVSVACGE